MQDGVDALKEAIFSLFSWTDFVTGGGVDDSLIVVVRGKHGVFEYFHIDAEVLKNTSGKYPLTEVSGQEKKHLKEKYGAHKVWDVEEIYQVGARNIWYYNVMAEQKQAA